MSYRITIAWTALALVVLILALADQDREWKRLQADFRERELTRLRAELDAELRRTAGESAALDGELARARERFAARRGEARRLERELARARHAASWAADELARLRVAGRGDGEAVRDARRRLDERRREELELTEQLAALAGELDDVEARRQAAARLPAALARRIAELERGRWWRRLPGLRGLDPTLAVVADAPPGLLRPTPAGTAARVDRCRTCHLRAHESALRSDADGEPSPFGVHPGRLVGDGTPHPAADFGCTVCHGGEGRATDFSRAGHWPTSAEQEAAWTARWGYARAAAPAAVILPPALAEAGCAHCHVSGVSASGAGRASLDRGRRLVARLGCDGCHTGGGHTGGGLPAGDGEDVERPGPPLDRLAVKTTPGWAFHWIAAPRRFRPTTPMPHLVDVAGDEARRTAEIRAMVLYLWSPDGGAPPAYGDPPAGDAGAGAALFATVGCTGCHLLDAAASRAGAPFERLHGPNLARTGNKVRAGWLYAWLLDPRSHRPDTPMPDLRLTAGEAADLTAFLMASRDPEWEGLELPPADAGVRAELVRELAEDEPTPAAGAARPAAMSAADAELYLGRRSLEAYGCHGCHEVPGLEAAPPVAAPLTMAGRDPRRWLPRPEDEGGSAALLAHRPRPGARAAPDYGWTADEADAVLVALLSRAPAAAEPRRRAEQRERARDLAAGHRLLTRYGCLGCHRLGGDGGAIAATLAGRDLRPPDLTAAGARFQPSWLFAYLRDPAAFARRPWLTVRMPTFHLRPEETDALVRYFAARDGEPLFAAPPPVPAKRDVEVGSAVAAMLQCHACHLAARDAEQLAPPELAPPYRGVAERLRPRWVVEWILDPRRFVADTAMPVTFPHDHRGAPDASYLKATIAAPMFNDQRARLLPYFASERELLAYLEDAPRVARALRDYLWSLE